MGERRRGRRIWRQTWRRENYNTVILGEMLYFCECIYRKMTWASSSDGVKGGWVEEVYVGEEAHVHLSVGIGCFNSTDNLSSPMHYIPVKWRRKLILWPFMCVFTR